MKDLFSSLAGLAFKGTDFDLETFQTFGFGVVSMLGGPDIPKHIAGTADDFEAIEDAFTKLASVARLCKEAVTDGIVTTDELNGIVAAAGTIEEALETIQAKLEETLGMSSDDGGTE